MTYSPLIERKQRLRAILPKRSWRLLYCDHVEADGEELFALACKNDLEGIVAKHRFGPYLQASAQWFKIRNRKFSQWAGREKFFEREREVDPDIFLWDRTVELGGLASVDPQLKQLMKELGDAINESLSDSRQTSEVVSRIKTISSLT